MTLINSNFTWWVNLISIGTSFFKNFPYKFSHYNDIYDK